MASVPLESSPPPTSYALTPTSILQIFVSAFLVTPLLILKSLPKFVGVLVQKSILLVVKSPTPSPEQFGEAVDGKGKPQGEAEAKAERWQGVRRLGGVTLTITVSVGAIRLIVVTVTVVALTLWIPLYPSARSFLSLFDKLRRTENCSGGRRGFVVSISVGP
jgi:hypothetical protein